jgi:hypothetical protein
MSFAMITVKPVYLGLKNSGRFLKIVHQKLLLILGKWGPGQFLEADGHSSEVVVNKGLTVLTLCFVFVITDFHFIFQISNFNGLQQSNC